LNLFFNPPSFWWFDDVSVEAARTPEWLSTLWLAFPIAGMIAFRLMRRRTA
jgi:hypothetical protein